MEKNYTLIQTRYYRNDNEDWDDFSQNIRFFETYDEAKKFWDSAEFAEIKNRARADDRMSISDTTDFYLYEHNKGERPCVLGCESKMIYILKGENWYDRYLAGKRS